MPTEKTFGTWIKERMRERRMTGLECAARANMKQSVWSRWESDRIRRKDGLPSQPRRETVEAIALALDVPLWEALAAAGYATSETGEIDREIASIYESVPPQKRSTFKRALRYIVEIAQQPAPPTPADIPPLGDYIALDLKTNQILTGDISPKSWKKTALTRTLLRDLISQLITLQAQEQLDIEDFAEILNNIDATIKDIDHNI